MAKIPHSNANFVQGLYYKDGLLFESNGLVGRSSLKKINAKSGREIKSLEISNYFCEGIAEINEKIYQLTWRDKKVLVYNENFELLKEINYSPEGWGIARVNDGLVTSDGSCNLVFRNANTLKEKRRITVTLNGKKIDKLNELEYADNKIYANVWMSDSIIIINKKNGRVSGIVKVKELCKKYSLPRQGAVLNGIAWDKKEKVFYITGKLWPWIFKVVFVEE